MAIWDKLKTELDRAGKAAQNALDEGKIRLEAFRTRQLADKAAQALGYAVYRAKQSGTDLDPDSFERLKATLATHETEASRLEQQLRDISQSETSEAGPHSARTAFVRGVGSCGSGRD
ncbi:MAG: hypothetical protein K0S86_4332 [Geminicoccaceae bacterium]|nr:hypothetical protein [Geminicoccaceae bacterium]